MVGVLIEMRAAIQRRNIQGRKLWGTLALLLLALLLAGSTFVTGLPHYAHPGAGTDVLATLCFGWLLGWVAGPVITGDDSTLRMDYFKLLPISARKFAYALLGANFVNFSLVFSLIAFCGLVAYGAQSGAAAALVGVVAVVLDLALVVVASTVALGVLGPTLSSRRGRDFGAMLVALLITAVSLASTAVPYVAKKLTNGTSPVLAGIVRALPSGWGAEAVDAAGRGDWSLVGLCLAGLVLLIAALVAVWPPVLARRLTLSQGGRCTKRVRHHKYATAGRRILPTTPTGAVLGKELRMYARSNLRSLQLMIAFLVGVLACVIPSLSGSNTMLPFAGPLFTLIAAACFANLYGDNGTAMLVTLVVPRVGRADVRGRQWAWFLLVAPVGLLLTVVFTAISGEGWAWPWVLAGEPTLVLASTRLIMFGSVLSVVPLAPDGSPTPQRQLKVHIVLLALPVVALAPAVALLAAGAATGNGALSWLAVPVGIVWGALLWRLGERYTEGKLDAQGPEIFQRLPTRTA